jgi:RNA polymerase sigma-70 factor (ECF subfamily)
VDDLIQDVMVGFYAKSPQFIYDPSKGRFRGYLKRCTFNALCKRFRESVKFKGIPLDEVDPESLELESDWDAQWQQQLMRRAIERVRLESQNSQTYRAFELYVMMARSPADVSTELGISVDSVYKAKERMLAAIRQKVQELQEES